jgi:hypothetical protein
MQCIDLFALYMWGYRSCSWRPFRFPGRARLIKVQAMQLPIQQGYYLSKVAVKAVGPGHPVTLFLDSGVSADHPWYPAFSNGLDLGIPQGRPCLLLAFVPTLRCSRMQLPKPCSNLPSIAPSHSIHVLRTDAGLSRHL